MIDLDLARKICGRNAVNLYTYILDELSKKEIETEKHGREGSNLTVKYRFSNKIVNVVIYPNDKVSVYGDIGNEKDMSYEELEEKFRKSLLILT